MSSSQNVALLGRLTCDPKLRAGKGGASICTFNVESTFHLIDPAGIEFDSTAYLDVEVRNQLGVACWRSLKRGRRIHILGTPECSPDVKAPDTGDPHSWLRVVANEVTFLGPYPIGRTATLDSGPKTEMPERA